MAKILRELKVGLCTTKNDDVIEVTFQADDEVEIIKEWAEFWLVKDSQGHFYNLPKDAVAA